MGFAIGAVGAIRVPADAFRLGQPYAHRRRSVCWLLAAGGVDVAVAMGGGPYYCDAQGFEGGN
jgi:hypothetical protein